MSRELSPRQSAFVAAYAKHGVAERAAVEAGYSERTARGSAARLLSNAGIRAALARLASAAHSAAVADAAERRAWWSQVMRDTAQDIKARLKASELLGKTEGDFIDRVDNTGELTIRVSRE